MWCALVPCKREVSRALRLFGVLSQRTYLRFAVAIDHFWFTWGNTVGRHFELFGAVTSWLTPWGTLRVTPQRSIPGVVCSLGRQKLTALSILADHWCTGTPLSLVEQFWSHLSPSECVITAELVTLGLSSAEAHSEVCWGTFVIWSQFRKNFTALLSILTDHWGTGAILRLLGQ